MFGYLQLSMQINTSTLFHLQKHLFSYMHGGNCRYWQYPLTDQFTGKSVPTNRRSVYQYCFHSWFIYLLGWNKVMSFQSQKRLYNRKYLSVCPFVCHKAKPFNSLKSSFFIIHLSSFIILHSSFIIIHHSSFLLDSFTLRLLSFSACY